MLDQELKNQIKELFKALEGDIELSYLKSDHADQTLLVEMLNEVASLHEKITVHEEAGLAPFPEFQIARHGIATGIRFKGIPNGHEFSSLILAILNVDGKGKMPDPGIRDRIQRIKGPIQLETYISLSCENCPDVVQALNQMALLHSDFKHTMIDGAYVQDEINELGIQGVPSIVVAGKLLHSGKIAFIDLLQKIETHFGTTKKSSGPVDLGQYDVVVVGGGPAGASAAIYSSRKGLKTVLIAEKIGGQIQETKGIENMISVLYTEGPELSSQIQKHIQNYSIEVLEHRRVKSISKDANKKIELESGEFLFSNTVIITTGAKWRELQVPGEKEYIGRGVAFCPHCDGPYYKNKKIAVVGGGNSGVEAAIDLSGIAKEVILLEFGEQLKADQVLVNKLKSIPNISFVTSAQTKEVIGDGTRVNSLLYLDRSSKKEIKIDLDGVFVQIGLIPNSQFLKSTVELTPFGEIVVDAKGRTSENGIYAAGDVTTTPFKQIVIAMGEGAKVALSAYEDRMKSVVTVNAI